MLGFEAVNGRCTESCIIILMSLYGLSPCLRCWTINKRWQQELELSAGGAVRSSLQEHGDVTVRPKLFSCVVGFMKWRMGFRISRPRSAALVRLQPTAPIAQQTWRIKTTLAQAVSDHQFINTDSICKGTVMRWMCIYTLRCSSCVLGICFEASFIFSNLNVHYRLHTSPPPSL